MQQAVHICVQPVLIGCLKLQVIFRKRATNYRALLRKMTCEDKAPYDTTAPYAQIWQCMPSCYGVATMSRRLKITGLFCRISSLL